jgi:hypothetical protein
VVGEFVVLGGAGEVAVGGVLIVLGLFRDRVFE